MFAQIVLVEQFLLHGRKRGVKHFCVPSHKGEFFQHNGIVHGVFRACTPTERAVAVDQNGGNIVRTFIAERFHNHVAGFQLIFAADFFGRHFTRTRNFTVKIVAVGCPERFNPLPRLGKGGCPARMGVDNPADVGKGVIKHHVGVGVGRGVQIPFDLFAGFKRHDDHILRAHGVIFHAGGFDHH